MRSSNSFLMVFLAILVAGPVSAGKHNGGAMLVHTDDAINYTRLAPPDYCVEFENLDLTTCEDLNAQSNYEDPGGLLGTMVWLVAAFHHDAEPAVTVVYFGIEHNFAPGFIAGWGFCGPANTLEVPDAGWPEDWENAGNSVAFGSATHWRHVFPFYWFGLYGTAGDFLGTGINPRGGYAAYVSNDDPGFIDRITRFGTVRWFDEGENTCPVPPLVGACCIIDATCMVMFEAECEGSLFNGVYQGDGTTCESACGPCCYWRQGFDTITRRCIVTTYEDCLDEDRWNEIQLEVPWGDPPEMVVIGADWGAPGEWCTGDPEHGEGSRYCWDPRDDPFLLTACCDAEGICSFRPEVECGGEILDDTCWPIPCVTSSILETFTVEETTWGRLKSLYR